MKGWSRLFVMLLLWGGLELSGAPWPIIIAVILFVGAAFMEVDIVRLKREASSLQGRMETLEGEIAHLRLRRPSGSTGS